MKSIKNLTLAGLLAAGVAVFLTGAKADERSTDGAAFQGKVSSVDKSAQTMVIDGKTYQVLPTSKITKDQQSATANDLAAGDRVTGRYKRSTEDKLEVISMDVSKGTAEGETAGADEAGEPFRGRVSKVDASAKTVTVGNQIFHLLPTTRITRNGQPATFNDIKVGRQLAGRYKESAEENLEVLTVNIGPTGVGGTQGNASSEAGATFRGKVASVNRTAQTFTIDGHTFRILPTSTISAVDGTPAALANVKADQRVSGTYKMSADGKREVLSMQIVRDR